MSPKFGFLSTLSQAYFSKKIDEMIFVPVTINYTRVLEGETFPFELTGEEKVKESLTRILKAVEIFTMNLGSIYLDFCEPVYFS
jgi:glycerol-3-phosphate O-acyltransferase